MLPFHQRDPIAALVRADSDLDGVRALAGRPIARWGLAWMTEAYTAALAQRHIDAPEVRPVEGDPSAALRDRLVEVVPTWAETIPVRSYADVAVRTIPLDVEGYASGLVAGDHVPDDVVARMVRAVSTGFALQEHDPDPGLTAFTDFYPHVPRQDASDNWRYFLPFAGPEENRPRTADAARWERTVAAIEDAHGLAHLDAPRLLRSPTSPNQGPAAIHAAP